MEGVAIVGVAVVDFVGVMDVVDLWGCVVGGPGQARRPVSVTVVDFALVAPGQAVRAGAAAVAGMTVSVMRWY